MTRAVRSPGSTLKPLIYGLAFEEGLAHPESLIEDRPTGFGGYAPQNFDGFSRGTVTVREALTQSLNIPAIVALNAVGPAQPAGAAEARDGDGDAARRHRAGPCDRARRARRNASRSRRRSTRRSPTAAPRRRSPTASTARRRLQPERPVLAPSAAWYVADILSGVPPPVNASAGTGRLQDRHVVRLSRRVGDRLRRTVCRGRVGGTARRHARSRPLRHRHRRAHSFRSVQPDRSAPHAARAATGRDDPRRQYGGASRCRCGTSAGRAKQPSPTATSRRSPTRSTALRSISEFATATRSRW